MRIAYPDIGVCGLSCLLCPSYQTDAPSRCGGCKTEGRMGVGCALITCAVKKKGVEFCWDCSEKTGCTKWGKHREFGKVRDSSKSYQTLEADIAFVEEHGIAEYYCTQKAREAVLREMLRGFNDGRSKSFYCIAAAVMKAEELKEVLDRAKTDASALDIREKAGVLRSLLEEVAARQGYLLRLRK